MPINLKGRSFLTLLDFTKTEIEYLIDLSRSLKAKKSSGVVGKALQNKNIVLIFEKTSTRTRCAFEVAAFDEGGRVTFLTNSQMGVKESIEDTAKVLGRFYDGIEFRGYSQTTVEALARHSGVPVWNGLTDIFHPTQALADFLTLSEHLQRPSNRIKLCYVGDARNNVCNSLMIGAAKLGMNFCAIGPPTLLPEKAILKTAKQLAEESRSRIEVSDDVSRVASADCIYTDVWASLGEEEELPQRISLLRPYQVNDSLMKKAENPNVLFMHCLPAFHDDKTQIGAEMKERFQLDSMEVTDSVFRGRHSVVFDQAENRIHTAKAVMVATCGLV